MKRILILSALACLLNACSSVPPFSGSIITEQGEFRILPDGRIEVVIEPQATK